MKKHEIDLWRKKNSLSSNWARIMQNNNSLNSVNDTNGLFRCWCVHQCFPIILYWETFQDYVPYCHNLTGFSRIKWRVVDPFISIPCSKYNEKDKSKNCPENLFVVRFFLSWVWFVIITQSAKCFLLKRNHHEVSNLLPSKRQFQIQKCSEHRGFDCS